MEQFQHLEDLSIHSSCRTCLEKLNEMDVHHDIFALPDLQKKLSALVGRLLAAEPGDGLPINLCELCNRKIDDFYIFQQMCISARKRFHDYINLEKKPCSMEIAFDPNNLPMDQIIFAEAKKEFEDDDHISIDQFSELVKQEPLVYEQDQIKASSNDEAEDMKVEEKPIKFRSIKQNEEDTDEKVFHKKANLTSTKVKLECEICKKTFLKTERFEAHMRVHQGLKAYPCEQCDRSYARRSRLKLHIKENHEGRPKEKFPCTEPDCKSIMATKQTLQQHLREMHWNKGNKSRQPYICEDCGKVLQSFFSLKNHRYQHTGEQLPHECKQCQKRYMTKNQLIVHMKRHAGIKNYTCPHCGARKVTQNDLTKHINSHTKEKKFPCQFCGMVFYSVWNINRHKRIVHEGIKKYPCSYCGQTFGKAETRKHHEMIHTGEKPHQCKICHKRFIQLTALKKHTNVHLKQQRNKANEQWHKEA